MAETKTTAKTAAMTEEEIKAAHEKELEGFYNEKVPVMVRRPEGVKDNFFTVTVNGVNYQIEYGKEVFVPRSIKLILDESERNRERADKNAEEFINGSGFLGER